VGFAAKRAIKVRDRFGMAVQRDGQRSSNQLLNSPHETRPGSTYGKRDHAGMVHGEQHNPRHSDYRTQVSLPHTTTPAGPAR
jgi:hypothetical protein